MPIIKYYQDRHLVKRIPATASPEEVSLGLPW